MKCYCHKLRNHATVLFKEVKEVSRYSLAFSRNSCSAFPFPGGAHAAQIAWPNPGLGHSVPLGPGGFIPMGCFEDCSLRGNISLQFPELVLLLHVIS